MLLRTH